MAEAPSELNGATSDWRRYKVNRAAAASSRPPAQARTDRRTANRRGPRRSASVAAPAVAVTESWLVRCTKHHPVHAGPGLLTWSSRFLSQTMITYWPTRYSRAGLPKARRTPASEKAYALPDPGTATTNVAAGGGGIVPAVLGNPRVRLFPEVSRGDDEDLPAAGQRGAGRRPVLGEPAGQVVGHQPVGELLGLGLLLRLRRRPAESRQVTGEHRGEHRRQRESRQPAARQPRRRPCGPRGPRRTAARRRSRARPAAGACASRTCPPRAPPGCRRSAPA